MLIVQEKLTRGELSKISGNFFTDMIKGVVDVKKEILAIDAELHADLEAFLLEKGSAQQDLWGINLYPELLGEDFIEFDSMINIRPSQNNKSRTVEDEAAREIIRKIVRAKIDE
ncbi:MAG: DUF5674 family protein [Chitinispirillia bacterium]|nr:DUF5674 family protein [Chitinispirillia bacterium]